MNRYKQLCKYIDKHTMQEVDVWDNTAAFVYVTDMVEWKLVVNELEQLGWKSRGKCSNHLLKEGHACICLFTSSVLANLNGSSLWGGQYNHAFLLTLKNIETLWHLQLPVYRLRGRKGRRDTYAHLIDVNYNGDVCVTKIYSTEGEEEENEKY